MAGCLGVAAPVQVDITGKHRTGQIALRTCSFVFAPAQIICVYKSLVFLQFNDFRVVEFMPSNNTAGSAEQTLTPKDDFRISQRLAAGQHSGPEWQYPGHVAPFPYNRVYKAAKGHQAATLGIDRHPLRGALAKGLKKIGILGYGFSKKFRVSPAQICP